MKKNNSFYSHHDQQYIARRETREELIAESLVNGFSLSLSFSVSHSRRYVLLDKLLENRKASYIITRLYCELRKKNSKNRKLTRFVWDRSVQRGT